MAAIDIGNAATDRGSGFGAGGYTAIDLANPANATGAITSFEVWFNTANAGNTKIGTFSGSGTSYDDRDYETIGTVTYGSKQTFSGLNCDVTSGDFIGLYWTGSAILEADISGGSGVYYIAEDTFGQGAHTYTSIANYALSVYGAGSTPVYDETGKLQVILAAQGEADIQAMAETGKEQTILGVLTAADIQAMVETGKEVPILAVVGEADGWLYIETGKEQTILAIQGETDIQAMVETGKLQIVLVVPGEADVQTMQELGKLQVILSTLTSADIQTMSEPGRLQEILTVIDETEHLTLSETARLQVILSVLGESDIQAIVETARLQVILAVVGKKEGRLLTSRRTTSPTRVLDAIREEGEERVLDSEIVT